MTGVSGNPCLTTLIREIRGSSSYRNFVDLLRTHGIPRLYDCHAHVSSGRGEAFAAANASPLQPEYPFSVADINSLYDELFRSEGIAVTSVIFDTPLPVYNMAEKNEELLREIGKGDRPVAPTAEIAKVAPFAVITPEMSADQIQGYVAAGAKGFKMTPRTNSPHGKRGTISDITLAEMLNPAALRIADVHRLPLVVHLPQLVVSPRFKPSLKEELHQVVHRYQNLRIILAHLGQAQTPAKIEDLVRWVESNGLCEHIWMDISAVTVPSVLAIAFCSKLKLVFGTDIDFSLTERGRYVTFKYTGGQRVLCHGGDRRDAITALVSTSFGHQIKDFAAAEGIDLDAPMLLFQFEGICDAVQRLERGGRAEADTKLILENLFFRNAETLMGVAESGNCLSSP